VNDLRIGRVVERMERSTSTGFSKPRRAIRKSPKAPGQRKSEFQAVLDRPRHPRLDSHSAFPVQTRRRREQPAAGSQMTQERRRCRPLASRLVLPVRVAAATRLLEAALGAELAENRRRRPGRDLERTGPAPTVALRSGIALLLGRPLARALSRARRVSRTI